MLLGQDDRFLLQRCQTSIALPADAETPLDEILSGETDIQLRTTLYYDENVRVFIFLDIPTCPEEKLHAYISNLELRVDAWATADQNGDERSPANGASKRDLIASTNVTKIDDPFTLVRASDDEVILQLAWEVRLDLGRPRLRALHQSVTFLPVATISITEDELEDGDYLEPFAALEANILEPMSGIPGVKGHPYLPASRLEKTLPPSPKKGDQIRIKHIASKPVPAYTVVAPRLKYTRINTHSAHTSTIASLDIDMIPVLDTNGVIENVEVSMASGKALPLMPSPMPFPWKSRDCLSFLFDLQPVSPLEELAEAGPVIVSPNTNVNVDTLSISLLLKVNHSPTTTATIRMSWTASVDFSSALNPSFGAPSQPLQRTNRPSSLTLTTHLDMSKGIKVPQKSVASPSSARTASTNLQHQVIPTSIPRSESSFIEISFVAPTEPAHITVPFFWKVLIVNRSPKPVKLAIVPLPRIQRPTNTTQQFTKRHAPKASNASITSLNKAMGQSGKGHNRNALSTAKAVVDEQVLYALHHQAASAAPVDTDLVSLTSELRIGPLGIGQCHETEIRFVAYRTGTFAVDAIRVVDLAKETEGAVGTISDIRDLPEVVVVD